MAVKLAKLINIKAILRWLSVDKRHCYRRWRQQHQLQSTLTDNRAIDV